MAKRIPLLLISSPIGVWHLRRSRDLAQMLAGKDASMDFEVSTDGLEVKAILH